MGRICPILNHPLKDDGVLIDDKAVVSFIQKRNLDFLPGELVCRSCKQEVVKLFNKKLNKARELYRSRLRAGSVSSLKTSKTSSASSVHGDSEPLVEFEQEMQRHATTVSTTVDPLQQQQNATHSINNSNNASIRQIHGLHEIQQKNLHAIAVPNYEQMAGEPSAKVISENGKNQIANKTPAPPELRLQETNLMPRKRTIKDFLTKKAPVPNIPMTPPSTITARSSTSASKPTKKAAHITDSNTSDAGDDAIRLSQEPTTSKGANTNKRPRTVAIIDSEDEDDVHLSTNVANGTRLPHIQPIPPKRKPQSGNQKSLAQDIMDEYIKDITGG